MLTEAGASRGVVPSGDAALSEFTAGISKMLNKYGKVIILFFLISFLLLVSCAPSPERLDKLASCLTEKGAVMYGAYWCPHCQEQKERFGAAFSKINYVECGVQKQKCADENIKGLPTWRFKDGSSAEGVQEFSVLAKKAGCEW